VKAPTEQDLLRQVRDYLALQGAVVVRVNSGGLRATYNGKGRFIRYNDTPGCSDLLACYRGYFVAVEVKRPGQKPTPEQASFLDQVRRKGGVGIVATCLDDVERALERLA
jgi:hypothetical protein